MKLAACTFELSRDKAGRVHLLPYGEFRATDGRPFDVEAWYVTDTNGADIVTIANNSRNPLPIDYEHQIIHSKVNGKEAPSAGWMDYFYFNPQGIFADVRWTDKAAEYIKNGEYRYMSAVFTYDKNGYVTKILHASLTNTPALDGMEEAMVIAASYLLPQNQPLEPQGEPMDKQLLALLCGLFGTPNATEQEVTAALSALAESKGNSTVALSQVYTELNNQDQRVAALSAQMASPDPAKFVPVEQVAALQQEFNSLKINIENKEKSQLIQSALASGKLAPALKGWAESLSVAALSQYFDNAPAMAALSGTQSGGEAPNQRVAALSSAEVAAAKALGMNEAEYQQFMQETK